MVVTGFFVLCRPHKQYTSANNTGVILLIEAVRHLLVHVKLYSMTSHPSFISVASFHFFHLIQYGTANVIHVI